MRRRKEDDVKFVKIGLACSVLAEFREQLFLQRFERVGSDKESANRQQQDQQNCDKCGESQDYFSSPGHHSWTFPPRGPRLIALTDF